MEEAVKYSVSEELSLLFESQLPQENSDDTSWIRGRGRRMGRGEEWKWGAQSVCSTHLVMSVFWQSCGCHKVWRVCKFTHKTLCNRAKTTVP